MKWLLGTTKKLLKKLILEMAANWESLTAKTDPEITEDDRVRFRGAWSEHRNILGYTLLAELLYALRRALVNHDDLAGIKYDLLLVDEYQDLNACDLEVLRLLSEKGGCAVIATGDDDQSIYSWRNAAPEGIRRFPGDYEPSDNYPLSITFRCGERIIGWANYVISQDPDRPANKVMLSCLEGAPDGDVALLSFRTDKSEAKGIALLVKGLIESRGLQPSEIIVLMRSDYQRRFSGPIREELGKPGISTSDPNYILDIIGEPNNRQLVEVLKLLVLREDPVSWASLLHLTRSHFITSST